MKQRQRLYRYWFISLIILLSISAVLLPTQITLAKFAQTASSSVTGQAIPTPAVTPSVSVYVPLVLSGVGPASTPTPPAIDPMMTQVVGLTNQYRADNGCSTLTINDQLNLAASHHSEDMARNDFFGHTSSDGSNTGDRLAAVGYSSLAWAENIAAGYDTAEAVVSTWMSSSRHRANILNCKLKEIGVGYYYLSDDVGQVNYHHYWTQVFALPD